MLYKLLTREDQGLSPRKCCINILKRYYTAVQNRVYTSFYMFYLILAMSSLYTKPIGMTMDLLGLLELAGELTHCKEIASSKNSDIRKQDKLEIMIVKI